MGLLILLLYYVCYILLLYSVKAEHIVTTLDIVVTFNQQQHIMSYKIINHVSLKLPKGTLWSFETDTIITQRLFFRPIYQVTSEFPRGGINKVLSYLSHQTSS